MIKLINKLAVWMVISTGFMGFMIGGVLFFIFGLPFGYTASDIFIGAASIGVGALVGAVLVVVVCHNQGEDYEH